MENKMKICHICYGFPPATGGTETHNYSLVKYLIKKGYDVDVIVLRPKNVSKEEIRNAEKTTNKGIKIHNIFPKKFPLWIFQVKKAIKKIEKQGKIDVFDVHSSLHIFPLLFQKRKIIFSLHFFELSCPLASKNICPRPCKDASFLKCRACVNFVYYLKWKLITYIVFKKSSLFMAKFNYKKNLLIKAGINENRITIIPHWIDSNIFNMKKSNLKIKSGFNFLFFERMVPLKNPNILIKAFRRIQDRGVKLIFVGDGILRKYLENFSEKYDLNKKIIFTGRIPHNQLHNYLSLADCIVIPDRDCNYNWALLEAMYSKKPIIATNVAATNEILKDEYNAILCKPNVEDIANKMEYVMKNPKLCKKIAKNALITVKKKHNMKNLELYDKLLIDLMKK